MYVASQPPDPHLELGQAIEILMPIKVYWDVQKVQKKIDFLHASGSTQAENNSELKNLLSLIAPWIVDETKRQNIMDKVGKT